MAEETLVGRRGNFCESIHAIRVMALKISADFLNVLSREGQPPVAKAGIFLDIFQEKRVGLLQLSSIIKKQRLANEEVGKQDCVFRGISTVLNIFCLHQALCCGVVMPELSVGGCLINSDGDSGKRIILFSVSLFKKRKRLFKITSQAPVIS